MNGNQTIHTRGHKLTLTMALAFASLAAATAPPSTAAEFPGMVDVWVEIIAGHGALVEQNPKSSGNELVTNSCFERFGGSECSGADLGWTFCLGRARKLEADVPGIGSSDLSFPFKNWLIWRLCDSIMWYLVGFSSRDWTWNCEQVITRYWNGPIKRREVSQWSGPWSWSSGQRTCLLLWRSEFESRWSSVSCLTLCLQITKINKKEDEVGPFYKKIITVQRKLRGV